MASQGSCDQWVASAAGTNDFVDVCIAPTAEKVNFVPVAIRYPHRSYEVISFEAYGRGSSALLAWESQHLFDANASSPVPCDYL